MILDRDAITAPSPTGGGGDRRGWETDDDALDALAALGRADWKIVICCPEHSSESAEPSNRVPQLIRSALALRDAELGGLYGYPAALDSAATGIVACLTEIHQGIGIGREATVVIARSGRFADAAVDGHYRVILLSTDSTGANPRRPGAAAEVFAGLGAAAAALLEGERCC